MNVNRLIQNSMQIYGLISKTLQSAAKDANVKKAGYALEGLGPQSSWVFQVS
jgi:hypothetical protein